MSLNAGSLEHNWQARIENRGDAMAHMYGEEKSANILFIIGKDAEVCFDIDFNVFRKF